MDPIFNSVFASQFLLFTLALVRYWWKTSMKKQTNNNTTTTIKQGCSALLIWRSIEMNTMVVVYLNLTSAELKDARPGIEPPPNV